VIIEAGAHIGVDTEELAEYFPNGKIYAFEPVPSVFSQLLERTKPYKNVSCIPLALSNQTGTAIMHVSGGMSDGSSSLLPPKDHLIDHPDVTFDTKIHVECTTLDEWAVLNHIRKIDLLWLDMQGHELNALKAGLVTLKNVQAIYTEVNLKEVYDGAPLYGEVRAWLEGFGFQAAVEELPWEDSGNVLFVRKALS
jgi:FkbM family methyltransferase